MPSRISWPIFRLSFGIDLLLDLLQYLRRNVVGDVLGVQRQHPDFVLAQSQEIDHAQATSLATTGDAPPKLSNPSRARNDVPRFGIHHQELLHGGVFVIGEIVQHQLREELRLDERHRGDYTSLTDY